MAETRFLLAPRSRLHADDEPVLPPPVVGGPVFAEDVWDLAVAGLPARASPSDALVNFHSINDDHWRLLAKEYFWARLNQTVPGSNRLPPQSARAELSSFRIFANWVLDPAAHPSGFDGRLSSLDHGQLDAFVQVLRIGRDSQTVALYLRLVERLHDYSPFLSHDSLLIHPWRHHPPGRVAGAVRRGENKTPRIPQEVLGPFLRWALFYVDVASSDIRAAREELAALRCRQASLLISDEDAHRRLSEWAEELRRQGRGVQARKTKGQFPGPECDANLSSVAVECGLSPAFLRHRHDLRRLVGETVAELGLEPWPPSRAPTAHPVPLSWTTHTQAEVIGHLERYVELRRSTGRGIPCWTEARKQGTDGRLNLDLVAAQIGTARFDRHHHPGGCALLDSAAKELGLEPGGMDTVVSLDPSSGRPWRGRFGPNVVAAEAHHLRAACYVVCAYLSGMRDGEIMEIRRSASSVERSADGIVNLHRVRSIVSKGRRTPEPASWVVTEHVARALAVMERLDDGVLVFGSLQGDRVSAVNQLRDHVNYLATDEALAVPDISGDPLPFCTRQFRRKIACFIG
ncbi:MAG: hypothetical protein Q8K72_21585, partial [Acidimicrobiales bacterium]|nr:hypothetical protein [Acidimicrobiales bacterium]